MSTYAPARKPEHICLFPDLYVKKPKLQVLIKGAQYLRAPAGAAAGQMPQAYCVCEIPGKPKSKFRTQNIASLSPTWEFEQPKVEGFAVGDSLHFTVFSASPHQRQYRPGDAVEILAPPSTSFHKLNGRMGTILQPEAADSWLVAVQGEDPNRPIPLHSEFLEPANASQVDEVLGWCQLAYKKFCPNGTDKPIALHQTGSSAHACLMIHIPAIPVGAILQAESH
jgi:ribosomal protein L21E